MFENNEDVDIDDEFFNIVYENDEGYDEIEPLNVKTSIDTPAAFNTPPAIRKVIESPIDVSHGHNSFHLNSGEPSNQSIKQLSHGNNFLNSVRHIVGEKEKKRKASSPPSRTKRERKFPGPAGLLPDRKSLRGTPLKLSIPPDVESPSTPTTEDLCSQGRLSGSVLDEGPWQSLLSDLGPHAHLLDTVNVASVKRKAAARCFVGRKLPFLAAMLHHLDVSSADPCIILRDSTGEIHGTLHREVWQLFAAELVVGSVLVIRNVGLLSTGLSCRRHYLNITANNLVNIYTANPDKPPRQDLPSFSSIDFEKTMHQWQSLAAPPRNLGSPVIPLFNTTLPSSSAPCERTTSIRPTTSLSAIPSSSRVNQPSRPSGRILFPPCSNSNNNTLNHKLSNSSHSDNTPYRDSGSKTNPNIGRTNFNNSLFSNPKPKSNVRIENVQLLNKPAPGIKFDPIMLNSKTCNGVAFTNQSSSIEYIKDCERNLGNNSSRIILSQSTQLSVEEQSVVESVFDGIDADSLFDDDF